MDRALTATTEPRTTAERSSFVGRRSEIRAVRQSLESSRLVTLVGPGGVGKTRLALHAMGDLQRRFPDGTAFVDLAATHDAALVPSRVAVALDLRDVSGGWMVAEVARSLADRATLLVLDNCEHLIDSCGVLVDALLNWCPHVRVLATSRRPLDVEGEVLLEVPPLAVPDATSAADPLSSESVRLLLDRARALDRGWQPTPEEATALGEVCRRLDGVPLAIEMAAARLRTLDPAQLLARLDDPLTLLHRTGPVTPPRHRTLRDTMAWSYGLLSDHEQVLWRWASVFAGDFDLTAAEAVCSTARLPKPEVLDAITGLVEASVMTVERRDSGTRFRMLETVRTFGRELLEDSGEAPEALERHVRWCAALATEAARRYVAPDQPETFDRLEREHSELSAAIGHCLDTPELRRTGLQIATDLWLFWPARGHVTEGRRLLEALLGATSGEEPERAAGLTVAGFLELETTDPAAAIPLLEEGRRLADVVTHPFVLALATQYLGLAHMFSGNLSKADGLLRQAAEMHEGVDAHYAAFCLADVGITAVLAHSLDAAEEAFDVCLRRNEGGDPWTRSHALWGMALVQLLREAPADAAALGQDALRLMRRVDDRSGVARCIDALSWSAAARGDVPLAAKLAGAADAVWSSIPAKPPGPVLAFRKRFGEPAQRSLGAERWAARHAEGAALDRGAAVLLALGETVPTATVTHDPRRDVLTRRQHEVAALITEGLTDRQIAERLVISPRTAESHVEQILSRLNLRSRTEVAAWVVRGEQG